MRLHRAGFGQCLMAGPARDVHAHRCAAGNGLGGAAADTPYWEDNVKQRSCSSVVTINLVAFHIRDNFVVLFR